jgi:hypothetical protein
MIISHKDGNVYNNSLSNLDYYSTKEEIQNKSNNIAVDEKKSRVDILHEEIKKRIKSLPSLIQNLNLNYFPLNRYQIFKIDNHINKCQNITNSLINLNYYEIKKEIQIQFCTLTRIIGIEYICDNDSGFIEIKNSKNIIQKNSLKNDVFVIEKNKKMASIISFNNNNFDFDNIYYIKIIPSILINKKYYDDEKSRTMETININTSFKIVSILVEGQKETNIEKVLFN